MYNGIINVYKETGYTSFDVVARLRGILGQKKIGHTGTLDPDATGVLPVAVGNATKLVDMLTDKKKEYVATFILGMTTDTQDISGKVTDRSKVTCTDEKIRDVITSFTGDIKQIPPMYSAIKVGGRKLYELAREGKEIERKPRPVTIYDIEILSMDTCGEDPNITIKVECSKGTYIRTLCHDIGQELGCGAVMSSLKRTASGQFTIESAHTLDEIERLKQAGDIERLITPVDAFFADIPQVTVTGRELALVENGNRIALTDHKEEKIRIYGQEFMAVYELVDPKRRIYKPWLMFA